jgi:hypothetical protein
MTSMAPSPVQIQTSPESVPCSPSWLGEVALIGHYLRQLGLLEQMEERVRFARARFGIYHTIDFVVVLISYAALWGSHPAKLLEAFAALRRAIYGPVWMRATPLTLGSVPLSQSA